MNIRSRDFSILSLYLILSPDDSIDDPLQFCLYFPMVLLLVFLSLLLTDQNFIKTNLVCVPWVNAREKMGALP